MAKSETTRQMINKMAPKNTGVFEDTSAKRWNITFRPVAGGDDVVVTVEEKNITVIVGAMNGFTTFAIVAAE